MIKLLSPSGGKKKHVYGVSYMDELLKYFSVKYHGLFYLSQIPEMKKQDAEESAMQGSEDAPPTAGGMESPAAAKDSLDSNSPKESEPETPQTDSPPQGDEAASEGKVFIIYKVHCVPLA